MRSAVKRQKRKNTTKNTKIITTKTTNITPKKKKKELQKKLHVPSPLGGARVRNFPESTLLTILIYAKRTPRFSVLCIYI